MRASAVHGPMTAECALQIEYALVDTNGMKPKSKKKNGMKPKYLFFELYREILTIPTRSVYTNNRIYKNEYTHMDPIGLGTQNI